MGNNLTLHEARVIGSLIEKEITTPDQYPLSLNAIANACNQKSNRDPVLELDEATVQETVEGLVKRYLVSAKEGFSGRVTKYRHRFCNAGFGGLTFSQQELGIICVLLLRGPQTPGELRSRTNRLCPFRGVEEVEATLRGLMERKDGPFVARLRREPGKRDARYMHLFSGEAPPQEAAAVQLEDLPERLNTDRERLDRLQQSVNQLRREIDEIKSQLDRRRSSPTGER